MFLDCGIPRERIAGWLDEELSLETEGELRVFTRNGCSCRIQMEPLGKRTLGSFEIERTGLRITGDEAAQAEFMRVFTLRFASAGG